jgi:hypothetical protein
MKTFTNCSLVSFLVQKRMILKGKFFKIQFFFSITQENIVLRFNFFVLV